MWIECHGALKGREGFFRATQIQERRANQNVRRREAGCKRHRAPEVLDRGVEVTALCERRPEIHLRLGEVWGVRDGALVLPQRLVVAPERGQGGSQVVVRPRIRGFLASGVRPECLSRRPDAVPYDRPRSENEQ